MRLAIDLGSQLY